MRAGEGEPSGLNGRLRRSAEHRFPGGVVLTETCQFLPFHGGHLLRIWFDFHSSKVEAVGIESGIDSWVACAMGGGMEITGVWSNSN